MNGQITYGISAEKSLNEDEEMEDMTVKKKNIAMVVAIILLSNLLSVVTLAEDIEDMPVYHERLYDQAPIGARIDCVPTNTLNLSTAAYSGSWGPVQISTYTRVLMKTGNANKKMKISFNSSWDYPGPASTSKIKLELRDSGGTLIGSWTSGEKVNRPSYSTTFSPPSHNTWYYFKITVYGPVDSYGSLSVSNINK